MKRKFRRIAAWAATLTIGVSALAMFAGCSSQHPKVTITYTFNDVDYAVDYTLSRNQAPATVTHFLELVKEGYYNGLCIHDYAENGNYLKTGGYTYEDGELVERDYYAWIEDKIAHGAKFTTSVWKYDSVTGNRLENEPLYSVYGEFVNNGVLSTTEYSHSKGALVMDYTVKPASKQDVSVKRADKGKGNGGNPYNHLDYANNSATSLFYTYMGSGSPLKNDRCVFGMADNYGKQLEDGLLAAIQEYVADLDENESFTENRKVIINQNDPFDYVRTAGTNNDNTFDVPSVVITIKSIKIKRY